MTTKTFRGNTLQEAHDAAVAELGADLTIVGTRKLERSGLLGLARRAEYEVIAEPAAPPAPAPARPSHPFPELLRLRDAGADPARSDVEALREEVRSELRAIRAVLRHPGDSARSIEPAVRELEAEIAGLHDLILELRESKGNEPPEPMRRLLHAAGIEAAAARTITKRVRERGGEPATTEQSFRLSILDLIKTAPFPLEQTSRTVIALIGATGVGKTTTAAKLAAHAVLHQYRTVTLISCDGFRVGAVEQIGRFAALIGAELRSVRSRKQLDEVLAGLTTDVAIVDTSGGLNNDDLESSLAKVRARADGTVCETLLCVPAAMREVDAKRTARLAAPCRPTGLVVTKLDETSAPSGLVHVPLATRLPIAALCFGQRVPEDIAPAHPVALLDFICPPKPTRKATRAAPEPEPGPTHVS